MALSVQVKAGLRFGSDERNVGHAFREQPGRRKATPQIAEKLLPMPWRKVRAEKHWRGQMRYATSTDPTSLTCHASVDMAPSVADVPAAGRLAGVAAWHRWRHGSRFVRNNERGRPFVDR